MKTFALIAGALAATLLLASCGGGGSSMSGPGPSGPGPSGPAVDTVVAGDAFFRVQGRVERVNTSCRNMVCTLTYQGRSSTVDLRDSDPTDSTVTVSGQRTRNGVQFGRLTLQEPDARLDSYGAWGIYNVATPFASILSVQGVDVGFAMPVSYGVGSRSNPLSGSATWTGVMVGARAGTEVSGDAEMTVDLGASSLDLEFTNIAERSSGARRGDIGWQDVPMRRGAFQAAGLDGRFYGPNHEEAGGVFEHSGIAGAFSLARQ